MSKSKTFPTEYLPYLSQADISDRDKDIIRKYLTQDYTLKSIGGEYGISAPCVRQLMARAKQKLNRLYYADHPQPAPVRHKPFWEMDDEELWEYVVREESAKFKKWPLDKESSDPKREEARMQFLRASFELHKDIARDKREEESRSL